MAQLTYVDNNQINNKTIFQSTLPQVHHLDHVLKSLYHDLNCSRMCHRCTLSTSESEEKKRFHRLIHPDIAYRTSIRYLINNKLLVLPKLVKTSELWNNNFFFFFHFNRLVSLTRFQSTMLNMFAMSCTKWLYRMMRAHWPKIIQIFRRNRLLNGYWFPLFSVYSHHLIQFMVTHRPYVGKMQFFSPFATAK